jgi:hypothetical protein
MFRKEGKVSKTISMKGKNSKQREKKERMFRKGEKLR